MGKHTCPGGVKVARFSGMSEVRACQRSPVRFPCACRTLFSIEHCCIYLVFNMLFIFVKRMYS